MYIVLDYGTHHSVILADFRVRNSANFSNFWSATTRVCSRNIEGEGGGGWSNVSEPRERSMYIQSMYSVSVQYVCIIHV